MALATGGKGLTIAAALSSLQLPELALPTPHSLVIEISGQARGKKHCVLHGRHARPPPALLWCVQAEPRTDAKEFS